MHTTCKNVEILHDFKLKKNTQIFTIMTKQASAIPNDFHSVQIKPKLTKLNQLEKIALNHSKKH